MSEVRKLSNQQVKIETAAEPAVAKAPKERLRRRRIRERLHQAARESIERQGYEGTNIRSLAEAAQVSITTIYNIYKGKDDLILDALADLLSDLDTEARRQGADALHRHLLTRRATTRQIMATPRYAEAMSQMLYRARPGDRIVKLMMQDLIARSREVVFELVAEDFIHPNVDVEYLTRQIAMASFGVTLMWNKGFVAIQDLTREHLRNHMDTIARVATPKGLARLRELEALMA